MFAPSIYWSDAIKPLRLAVMPRPRGGEDLPDQIAALRGAKIDMMLSLLEAHEVRELELKQQATLCAKEGIAYYAFPIPDRGVPASMKEFALLAKQLHEALLQGKSLAIHCRAGIGRTGLFAACLLHLSGVPKAQIFALLSKARGVPMPDTEQQIDWLTRFAKEHP